MTIFVLAVGLLGVAALMPVGSFQMQRGQIAQRVSEIGPAALDELEARDFTNPGKWLTASGNHFDAVLDRAYDYAAGSRGTHPVDGTPLEPVYDRSAFPVASSGSFTPSPNFSAALTAALDEGGFFLLEFARCSDARLFGGQWRARNTPLGNTSASLSPTAGDVYSLRRCEPFAIDPLYVARHNAGDAFVPSAWGSGIHMPRLTLHGGLDNPRAVMGQQAAESIFESDVDLKFLTDETGMVNEREAHADANGNALKRKVEGNYSWLATFAPSESTSGNDPRSWTVSVAVFYKRPLGVRFAANPETDPQRTLVLKVDATGNASLETGGTAGLLFEDTNGDGSLQKEAGEQMRVKRGMWGLVTFEHLDAGGQSHRKARWYRMGAVGKPTAPTADDANHSTPVRLIGPDLPNGTASITFFDNLEGVFSRTIAAEELPLGPTN